MSTDTPKTPGAPPDRPQQESAQQESAQPGRSPGAGQPQTAEQGARTEEIRERAREVQERIEEGYHELEQRYDDARMQLRQANDTAIHFIRENPTLCIIGAVGIGYFVGRLASRRWLT